MAVGEPTGIFTDWAEASLAIKGVKGPKYKRFPSQAEAVDYIKEFGSPASFEALGDLRKLASTTALAAPPVVDSPEHCGQDL